MAGKCERIRQVQQQTMLVLSAMHRISENRKQSAGMDILWCVAGFSSLYNTVVSTGLATPTRVFTFREIALHLVVAIGIRSEHDARSYASEENWYIVSNRRRSE